MITPPNPNCGDCAGTGYIHFDGGGDVCHCTRRSMKHTPGPWRAHSVFINNAPNRMIVQRAVWGGINVADCGEVSDETAANARLIAAAPELLKLLKESQDSIAGDWRARRDALLARIDTPTD